MIIVKVGGGKDINWDYLAQDIKNQKEPLIIVHGANAYMKEVCEKLGISEKIITSPSGHISRYTDKETINVLTMVYSGLINKRIVGTLQKYRVNAVGLSGVDGRLWQGERKKTILSKEGDKIKVIRDSNTGNVTKINNSLICLLLDHRYIPVLTIPAITACGELINVDNDRVVAVMARELKIKKIVMLFEARGLLKDIHNEKSLIKRITKNELEIYISKTQGRMRKKLLGVKEALSFGVETIYFGDGRIPNPISSALKGFGTVIN